MAPGVNCGVRTSLVWGEAVASVSAQLDTVWQVLDTQCKGGGEMFPLTPLGYSKALINHVDTLIGHSGQAFKTAA